jgi:hypothetical protein
MITTKDFADLVSHHTDLKQIGRERWRGSCPLPDHVEKTPSFDVFQGKDGKPRFHCFGCSGDGDAIDFLRRVEGKTFREAAAIVRGEGAYTPSPSLSQVRQERKETEARVQAFRDRNPDSVAPEWYLRSHPEMTGPPTRRTETPDQKVWSKLADAADERLAQLDARLKHRLLM